VTAERLEAGDALCLSFAADGARLEWHHADWLGPIGVVWRGESRAAPEHAGAFEGEDALGTFRGLDLFWKDLAGAPRTQVRAYRDRPVLVFRSEAEAPLRGLATGSFDEPVLAWPHFRPAERRAGGLPDGATAFGYAYTEFCLPTFSGPGCARFFLMPDRPAVVQPLCLRTDDACLLVCPLDAFHDQVIAVPRSRDVSDRGVRCGWHGDLDEVQAGFASEVAVWGARGVRDALESFGAHLLARHATRRPSRYADTAVGSLSYWTDNGAAYWYRTEPGRGVEQTLAEVMDGLRAQAVPVRAVELDSWFYPHQVTRPLNDPSAIVPPTGLVAWEPRADALPDGIPALRERLGGPPLILHLRHFSSASPYFADRAAWRDGDRAHPVDAGPFYEMLFDQALAWGAVQVEHDWLVECFLGVRGLRERPGRARAWQRAVDLAAERRGLSLSWCMATPADLLASAELSRVAAVRTAGDYRYGLPSPQGWCWFLYGNALARALGLWPFKDVFLSSAQGEGLDGDRHAELEALLAALSGGPVGIGDRLGRTRREVVMRTCRADGVLVKPDAPLAALERCFRGHAHRAGELFAGETHTDHPAGRVRYLLAVHAGRAPDTLRLEVALAELGVAPDGAPLVARDWRSGETRMLRADASLAFALAPGEWSLQQIAPLLPAGLAVFGDPALYASAGDRRLRDLRATADGAALELLGAPGEAPELCGASLHPLDATLAIGASDERRVPVPVGAGGAFSLRVPIGARGRTAVRLRVLPRELGAT
jgi:hypothetical protein